MRVRSIILLCVIVISAYPLGGCGSTETTAPSGGITARELVQPNALVGPGPENLAWSPAGARLAYTLADDGGNVKLWLYDASTAEDKVLFDPAGQPDRIDPTSFQWSPTGQSMLLSGDETLVVLDVTSGGLTPVNLAGGGDLDAMMFTPDGARVSYTRGNDLYVTRLADGQSKRLTTDGSQAVFNGCLDWVYNEELATRAAQPGYAWSPNGKWLAYMRLDDSGVRNDPITDYDPVPPSVEYTRYPAAGTPNPVVSLSIISPDKGGAAREIALPAGTEYVLPFFAWDPGSSEFFYISVNRGHTVLRLNAFNPVTGSARLVIEETDGAWINEDFYSAPVFLPEGQRFLWLSERDGFMHLYLYTINGTQMKQLTDGGWLIDTTPYGILTAGRPVYVDPSGTWVYFNSTAAGPLERRLYRLNIGSGAMEELSWQTGFNQAALSGDGQWLVDQFSAVDTPPVTWVMRADGSEATELARCAGPALDLPEVSREFLTVEAYDGTDLYAQMVKPENFDAKKKYPVIIHWYGGPGLQLVSDRYGTTNIFNHIERDTLYTQAGFIVWRLDNRGSFGRGHGFETPIEGQLGAAALEDQLAGVDYLKTLSYVDTERIGTDGKSFGGYMTLYALIHQPEVFRCGVAGSGPTDWTYYDTIYTERYMKTPAENPEGYDYTNLVTRAGQIEAAPLIIHGLADTNVHLQNSVNFIAALERADRPFYFVPLPNENHHYEGDGLATALSASVEYFTEQMGGD